MRLVSVWDEINLQFLMFNAKSIPRIVIFLMNTNVFEEYIKFC